MSVPPETVDTENQPDVPIQPVSDLPPPVSDLEHLRLTEQEVDMLHYNYLRQKAIKSAANHPQPPVTTDVPSPTPGR